MRRSENKEKARDGYVCMYECGENLSRSTYERACKLHKTTISLMKEIVEIFNFYIKEILSTNQDMWNYIDNCHKESLRRAVYPEQSTKHFENFAKNTVNSDSVIT